MRRRERIERRAKFDKGAALRLWAELVARREVSSAVEGILDTFGDDAKMAWARGEPWEFQPETSEGGEAFPEGGSDDLDPWRLIFLVPGWEIQPRSGPGGGPALVHVIWSADLDGDWGVADSHDLDAPDYAEWLARGALETAEAWLEYMEFVSAEGIDPLNEVVGGLTQASITIARRSAEKRLAKARFGVRRARAMQPAADDDPFVEVAQTGDAKRVDRLIAPRLAEARAALRGFGDPEFADDVDLLRGVSVAARTGRARCPNCGRLLPGFRDKAVAMVEALRGTTCHDVGVEDHGCV